MVVFENRSAAYLRVREHRIAEKRHLQTVSAEIMTERHPQIRSAANPAAPTISRHQPNSLKPWRDT